MKIKVIKGPKLTPNKIPSYVTAIKAKDILSNYSIDYKRESTNWGYQRKPSDSRLRSMAKKILKHDVMFPNSILLNVRSDDAVQRVNDEEFDYEPDIHGPFWVVDGQHRIKSIETAISILKEEENPDLEKIKELENTIFHISLIFTQQIEFEIFMFLEINKEAKRVPINLAEEVYYKLAETNAGIQELAYGDTNTMWKLAAGKLVNQIKNDHSGPWHRRIISANSPAAQPSVSFAGFQKSLKKFLECPAIEQSNSQQKFEILKAYWDAFDQEFPVMFNPETAAKYSIQSQIGATVLHDIFTSIRECISSFHPESLRNLKNPESYRPVVKFLIENCSGIDADGEDKQGVEFWRKGKDGAVSLFQGQAGYKRLEQEFKRSLNNYRY